MHLTDEQLILFHYKEADDADEIRAHLESCPTCRNAYQDLTRILGAVEKAPVPERDETFAAGIWERLRPQLWQPRSEKPVVVDARRGRWIAVAAVAAALILAFGLGRFLPHESPQQAAVTQDEAPPDNVRERIIVVAVGEHLEKSQMMLVELVNAGGNGTVDITSQRDRAADLIGDNRLYRLAAEEEGDAATADFLDELERLLVSVANADPEMPSEEYESLKHRIAQQGLLLKVRIFGSKLRQQTIDHARDPMRPTI
ncbi:MAG TPA: hypothetical protein VM118_03245 [Acidobacteriota bacterium]|nr:hypothetical protein [Acidobacteriota bacterium]